MALKSVLDDINAVPEAVRGLYAERDGKFVLDVDGIDDHPGVAALKSAHERTKQTAITERDRAKTLSDDLKRFDGIDPEKTRTMLAFIEKDEDARLIADGKVDDVVKRRTEREIARYQGELETRDLKLKAVQDDVAERDGLLAERDARIASLVIDQAVRSAGEKAGLVEGAADDAIMVARTVFVIENGEPVARDKDGNLIPGPKGALTVEEWLKGMQAKRAFWWPPTVGAPAPGGKGRQGIANPFAKETFNLTKQGDLVRDNPTLAEQLRKQAGGL